VYEYVLMVGDIVKYLKMTLERFRLEKVRTFFLKLCFLEFNECLVGIPNDQS
jgi:hypothetical protein